MDLSKDMKVTTEGLEPCSHCNYSECCPHMPTQESVCPMEEKFQEFCEYFAELSKQGIPYGLSELREEARKLGLPQPIYDEGLNLVRWSWGT